MIDDYKKYLLNFDDISDKVLDKPIYRVFSLEKFLTSLNENSLFLIKTKLWEDPYEAFLLKQLIWKDDGLENYPFRNHLVENFFGQCWTFLKESNLLWKVYAPNNDGVIVKSSIRKIIELFIKNQNNWGEFFLGKVEYIDEKEIIEYYEREDTVSSLMSSIDGSRVILKSLFTKRQEFRGEEEIRLIYYSFTSSGRGIDLIKNGFIIEKRHLFNELADEIILDPRIGPIRSDSIRKLIEKIGFKGAISKSTLFNPPYLKLRTKGIAKN